MIRVKHLESMVFNLMNEFFFARKRETLLLRERITILSNHMLNNSWSCKTPNRRMSCSPCQLRELVCNAITLSSRVANSNASSRMKPTVICSAPISLLFQQETCSLTPRSIFACTIPLQASALLYMLGPLSLLHRYPCSYMTMQLTELRLYHL